MRDLLVFMADLFRRADENTARQGRVQRVGRIVPKSGIVRKRLTPSRAGDRAPRIEVWVAALGRFRFAGYHWTWPSALGALTPSGRNRRRFRIRTFYDRHLRCRVVQVLIGNGWGVR